MEPNEYLLQRDSNGNIDVVKFNVHQVTGTFEKTIKVLEANFIQPLFNCLNSDLNQLNHIKNG